MSYAFELLGPERFQYVCQSLLLESYPDTQCLPVAQPDGGRDAFTLDASKEIEHVFQVKYVRSPDSWNDVVEWLEGVVDLEIDKVVKLAERGAKRYFLLTNSHGTAHLDKGSVDRLQAQLNRLPIPAVCWWREDLSRRLDNAWNIKWRYPELLTGQDLLRVLVESKLSGETLRRSASVRAFITDQLAREGEVKFKQVELQNRLLDLFVDVPLGYEEERVSSSVRYYRAAVFRGTSLRLEPLTIAKSNARVSSFGAYREDIGYPAAAFLLDGHIQRTIKKVVIEGAPGQGKSTISQYICQVHRLKMLNKPEAANLAAAERLAAVRLPFKVDLRDLAAWLDRLDPFALEPSDGPPAHWVKSLESFLAAQVRYHSGGSDFSVSDLIAVFEVSAVLIVFDGLDEVGKRQQRQAVIEEIVTGIRRLEANCRDLQIVVTSRPAAFAMSPGLPASEFAHFSLAQLPRDIIDKYAEKWIRAKGLQPHESKDVRRILRDKLNAPHLRDLARNPMQLAILLSLIHTRGSSLPDKRTALYDSYMELFFNREAEKSKVVRDHRALLVDIHRFLGWELHARSETGKGRGSIGADELQRLVYDYLDKHEHDKSLATELFDGMIERVVAIVSRVEGTYEFEVQPLREYFAARHLYETAPYSPPGNEKHGTKLDRFDALARNFYWLNVVRFYAGCYSVGELSSLIDGLKALAEDTNFRYISHPKTLAATLLSDWVFAQNPRSVKEALHFILDGSGLPFYMASFQRRRMDRSYLELPNEAGRKELLDRAFAVLEDTRRGGNRLAFHQSIDIINQNRGSPDLKERWLSVLSSCRSHSERTRWLDIGVNLGYVGQAGVCELDALYNGHSIGEDEIQGLLRSGKASWLESSGARFSQALAAIARTTMWLGGSKNRHLLEALTTLLDPEIYSYLFSQPEGMSALEAIRSAVPWKVGDFESLATPRSEETAAGWRIYDSLTNELAKPVSSWATQIGPWSTIVEPLRDLVGDRGVPLFLSAIAANIRSPQEQCVDSNALLDRTKPLARRVRYARMRAGQSAWWQKQLVAAKSSEDIELILTVITMWASTSTIAACMKPLEDAVASLPLAAWVRVNLDVASMFGVVKRYSSSAGQGVVFDGPLPSARLGTLLVWRTSNRTRKYLYEKVFGPYVGNEYPTLCVQMTLAIGEVAQGGTVAENALANVERAYVNGASSGYGWSHPERQMAPDIARHILSRPDKMPSNLLSAAEDCLRSAVGKSAVPVLQTARTHRWFD